MSITEYSTKATQNASLWRERVARHIASGKTIAVFCREEGIGQSTLSNWRRRLGVTATAASLPKPAVAAPFLDAGPVKDAKPLPPSAAPADVPREAPPASIELRLELGHGVVLHIARH
jgi:transposase-like protein